jgi:hypothetical protein
LQAPTGSDGASPYRRLQRLRRSFALGASSASDGASPYRLFDALSPSPYRRLPYQIEASFQAERRWRRTEPFLTVKLAPRLSSRVG